MTTQAPSRREDFRLPIRKEETLRAFVKSAFGVTIPNTRVCPNHSTPWEAFAAAYFARSQVSVWKASRGFGGKSYLLALLGATEGATLKADVNILGGSGEQAKRVLAHSNKFWTYKNAPAQLLTGTVSRETRFVWGNVIQSLMASQTSVRGPHPQRLRVDEVDETSIDIIDASSGQTMDARGILSNTVYSSTHQYPAGTMTEVLSRADLKGWPVFEWCWRETSAAPDGWLSKEQIDKKRGEVTEQVWTTEYDLQEPSSDDRAISTPKVDAMFRRDLGVFEGTLDEYIETEAPAVWRDKRGRTRRGSYATGADWAKSSDFTIIWTLRYDVTPKRFVAFRRMGREPWPDMIAAYDAQRERFKGGAAHDETGIGDVIDDYISGGEGYTLSGKVRNNLLTNYIIEVESGRLISPYISWAHKEHKHATRNDLYGSGHLPDTICAGALAVEASSGSWVA